MHAKLSLLSAASSPINDVETIVHGAPERFGITLRWHCATR